MDITIRQTAYIPRKALTASDGINIGKFVVAYHFICNR